MSSIKSMCRTMQHSSSARWRAYKLSMISSAAFLDGLVVRQMVAPSGVCYS